MDAASTDAQPSPISEGQMESEQDDTTDEIDLAGMYPYPDIGPEWSGKDAATALIRTWVETAFELIPYRADPLLPLPQAPGSVFAHRMPIARGHSEWSTLQLDTALRAWMVVVSKDDSLAKAFGHTRRPLDVDFLALASLAFDFLNYLLPTSGPKLDPGVFQDAADNLWTALHTDTPYECGAVLPNLRGTGEAIPLGGTYVLQPVTPTWARERFQTTRDLPDSAWALTFTYSFPRSAFPDNDRHDRDRTEAAILERGLLPLRLVIPQYYVLGSAIPLHRYRIPLEGSFEAAYRPWAPTPSIVLDPWFPEITLDQTVLSELSNLGPIIPQPGNAPDLLELVIRYYQASFTRSVWEDRIVDLAICLEALFSRGDGEITHKVATRCALLLGGDKEDSIRLADTVRHLYAVRSDIVHAESSKKDRDREIEKTIRSWQGPNAFPQVKRNRGFIAADIATQIVASAIRAFIYLHNRGEHPFPKERHEFTKRLDHLAFSEAGRTKLQAAAKGIDLPPSSTPQHLPRPTG
jgi:hypothetical protein